MNRVPDRFVSLPNRGRPWRPRIDWLARLDYYGEPCPVNRLPPPPAVPAEAREVALTMPPPSVWAALAADEHWWSGRRDDALVAEDERRMECADDHDRSAAARERSRCAAWAALERAAGVHVPDFAPGWGVQDLRGVRFVWRDGAWTCDGGAVETLRRLYG